MVNNEIAVTLEKLELTNGHILENCTLDGTITAPPGFIAVRTDNAPGMIKYIKVDNIAAFNVNEQEQPTLWGIFDVLPETTIIKKG